MKTENEKLLKDFEKLTSRLGKIITEEAILSMRRESKKVSLGHEIKKLRSKILSRMRGEVVITEKEYTGEVTLYCGAYKCPCGNEVYDLIGVCDGCGSEIIWRIENKPRQAAKDIHQ